LFTALYIGYKDTNLMHFRMQKQIEQLISIVCAVTMEAGESLIIAV
jgi:hypothetical protein